MDFKEILELICLILCGIGFICIVIFSIIDIIKSNKYWKKMEAELELYRGALHKNPIPHNIKHINSNISLKSIILPPRI